MPAGLLGAGLLLCMERGQVNRKGIAGGRQGGGSIAWEGHKYNRQQEVTGLSRQVFIVTLLMGIISCSLQT